MRVDLGSARHAFVTGGASGIGRGIVEALADAGVRVTIADIDRSGAETVAATRPGELAALELDVRDRAGWRAAKAQAEKRFGPVDILVNNAGIGFNGRDIADLDPEVFDRIIDIDLTGVFNGISTFAADLRVRGRGHIVNTASVMALTAGAPGRGAYSAAKSAVVAMSEALRQEMAPHGVGVSVLCPGLVRSNLDSTTARLGGQVEEVVHIKGDGSLGMDPAEAGARVLDGITRDLPYILTHPHYLSHVDARMDALHRSFTEAEAAGAPR
ncbi:SDR family oxidoreductase [Rhodococcus zopfii]|uniref:SDR family oxidoreductase n=1 Tax=Rhodococcus zopfii TaxID=43772 RepID=UPI003645F818